MPGKSPRRYEDVVPLHKHIERTLSKRAPGDDVIIYRRHHTCGGTELTQRSLGLQGNVANPWLGLWLSLDAWRAPPSPQIPSRGQGPQPAHRPTGGEMIVAWSARSTV